MLARSTSFLVTMLIAQAISPLSAQDTTSVAASPPVDPAGVATESSSLDSPAKLVTSIEARLDPQRHNLVGIELYDPATGHVAVGGLVETADDLAALRQALEATPGVSAVETAEVVVTAEAGRPPETAFREILRSLQDGKDFQKVLTEARALIASSEPGIRAAGFAFSAIAALELADTGRAAGYLRLLHRVDPLLLDPDQLRAFLSYDNFAGLARVSFEIWNTDIVNPYLTPSSPVAVFLREIESPEALIAFAIVPAAGAEEDVHFVSTDEAVPADLPADVVTGGELLPPVPVVGCVGCARGGWSGGGWPPGYVCPATYHAFDWTLGRTGYAWPGPCPWCPNGGLWYPYAAVWAPVYWHVPTAIHYHPRWPLRWGL